MAQAAHRKGLEIHLRMAPDAPVGVRADPGRLRQVMLNLLSNAVKFTSRGEVNVAVSLAGTIEGDSLVRIEVADTGIGISQKSQAQLFQSFSQADASTTRRFGGTGLGLPISKRLVELMGGNIGLVSEPGCGARFHFTVRLQLSDSAAIAEKRLASLPAGIRILIVDDSSTNLEILAYQLRQANVLADCASDAPTALSKPAAACERGQPYEIAILDLRMPIVDEMMLTRTIRARRSLDSLRLILLTSSTDRERVAEARSLGVFASLAKPIRQRHLIDCLLRAYSTVPDAGQIEPLPEPVRPKAQAEAKARILLAEDNPTNQKVAVLLLQRLGYRVDVVGNGQEAVEASAAIPYDVILMDCQMPEMDGFEATHKIRQREGAGRRTPVIALTANALLGERERCLKAGMDDYLSKPVRAEALGKLLASWVAASPDAPPPNVRQSAGSLPVSESSASASLKSLQSSIFSFQNEYRTVRPEAEPNESSGAAPWVKDGSKP